MADKTGSESRVAETSVSRNSLGLRNKVEPLRLDQVLQLPFGSLAMSKWQPIPTGKWYEIWSVSRGSEWSKVLLSLSFPTTK